MHIVFQCFLTGFPAALVRPQVHCRQYIIGPRYSQGCTQCSFHLHYSNNISNSSSPITGRFVIGRNKDKKCKKSGASGRRRGCLYLIELQSRAGVQNKTVKRGTRMERARVIGCIRVVRKLMPLETVCKWGRPFGWRADFSMCITQPHKSGSPRLACLLWFGFNYLSYPALTTSTSLMGLPRSGITHTQSGQLAGWPGGGSLALLL